MALDRNFRLLYGNTRRVRFYNNSGVDLSEGDAIYHSGGTVAEVGDSNTVGILGVLCEDVDSGDYGWIWIDGVFRVACAASMNFTQFGAVYTASASTVDTGTGSDVAIGYVVDEDPADGASYVNVAILSTLFTATTHA